MIHVVYDEGIELKGLYDAVWVTGILEADNTMQNVSYSDGQADIEVGYIMHPSLVEAY